MVPVNATETIDHTGNCRWCIGGADTRVIEYASRAPMTYPVRFDHLPAWPPARSSEVRADVMGTAGRSFRRGSMPDPRD